jgi:signal transduction histidine kinase
LNLLNANVSHEINTPINCIMSFADLIIHKVADKQAKWLGKMILNASN